MDFQGAEAKVKIGEEVEKKRLKKGYRHPELDKKIRKDRNSQEASILREASRASANVPQILEEDKHRLKMERIRGKPLKDNLESTYCKEVGENLAKLHDSDIIHGDLTTSNIMVSEEAYIIDFGLSFRSERIEDRAMDLHMFKQILESSHPEEAEKCWNSFLEGYSDYDKSKEVLHRLEDVELRGRYKT